MDPEYWKAFNAGREYERKRCIEVFEKKIEILRDVKGIGESTIQKIIDSINMPFTK
jgi:hypothetical protein